VYPTCKINGHRAKKCPPLPLHRTRAYTWVCSWVSNSPAYTPPKCRHKPHPGRASSAPLVWPATALKLPDPCFHKHEPVLLLFSTFGPDSRFPPRTLQWGLQFLCASSSPSLSVGLRIRKGVSSTSYSAMAGAIPPRMAASHSSWSTTPSRFKSTSLNAVLKAGPRLASRLVVLYCLAQVVIN